MANRGFTLIELIIVIAIIGILAGLGMTNYVTSQKRARDGRRKADLEQIRSALEMCRADTGSYPGGACSGGSLSCGSSSYTIPTVDPCTYSGGGASYTLCTTLEIGSAAYCASNP